MFILPKKQVASDGLAFVKEATRTYFAHLKQLGVDFTGVEISELYRHSMCVVLGLESELNTHYDLKDYEQGVVKALKPVVKKYNLLSKDKGFKQGILEACVHGIEFTRKKVVG